MKLLLESLKITLSFLGLLFTFYGVLNLTYFLSFVKPSSTTVNTATDILQETSWALLKNMSLLSLFIFQHSFMASEKLKNIINSYKLQATFRSIYIIISSCILLILIKNWHITTEIVLWKLDLNCRSVWWLYVTIHTLAWFVIYMANICMDVTELLGMKQIYYSLLNLPAPKNRKSYEFSRLNTHLGHPSFLSLLLILWLYPDMTLDRLLLSSILSLYMFVGWTTDGEDYSYQEYQYKRKCTELTYLHQH